MTTDGSYALDTSVAVAILNGEQASSEHWRRASPVRLPVPVLGELLVGARRSGRPTYNEERVWKFTDLLILLPCDAKVGRTYADIWVALMAAGRPIPENDVWVAACCLAAGAVLVSRDRHFDAVEGLQREEWR